MGAALMFEGILSGCYHICPTAENFQFDTTFMYCISVLVFLKVSVYFIVFWHFNSSFSKVYQFRHCDVTHTAHIVFTVIGLALIFEVVGIFTDHILFWIVFVMVYITFVFIFIIQVSCKYLPIQQLKQYFSDLL